MKYVNQNIWVDFVRATSTFAVVFLHSAAPILYKFNEVPLDHWMIGNIYDATVRMCVPLFFMITGYLLLQKDEPLLMFFSKRINKVLIPLIVWSIFYIFWWIYYAKNIEWSFYIFYARILSPAAFHLWFLYAIIGIYICMPILRKVVRNSSHSFLVYYVVLWVFATSIIPIGEKISGFNSFVDLAVVSGYSGYLILGLLLGEMRITTRYFALSAMAIPVLISVTAYGTYILTVQAGGNLSEFFYGYLALNVIALSIATFIFLKYIASTAQFFSSNKIESIIRMISSASLGIYLIHPMALDILRNGDIGVKLSAFSGHPIFAIPLTAIVAFFLSFAAIFTLKKTPILKKLVP